MASIVINSLQIRLTNQRCGKKLGLTGINALFSNFLYYHKYSFKYKNDIIWLFIVLFIFYAWTFSKFGGSMSQQPTEDLAFSVAKFIQMRVVYLLLHNNFIVYWI